MPRPRHKCKEVETILKRLEAAGWTIVYPSGHWGRADCGDGCHVGISGTPRDCVNLSRRVERTARRCPHGHETF